MHALNTRFESTKALVVLALANEVLGTSLRNTSLEYLNHEKCCGIKETITEVCTVKQVDNQESSVKRMPNSTF